MILRLAVLIQYRNVTDTHTETDGRTDRYTTTAYTALSIASRGKIQATMSSLETVRAYVTSEGEGRASMAWIEQAA